MFRLFDGGKVSLAIALTLYLLAADVSGALAQAPSKGPAKAVATKETPKTAADVSEPATVEFASKILDLRTFPRIGDAKPGGLFSLGELMYEAKSTPKEAFEIQRAELTKRGFKEMPGGYSDANNASGHFTKDNFVVAVSTSPAFGDGDKAGKVNVTLVNRGNVDLNKLPVPPGVKPFYPNPDEASYTTTAKVQEVAAACRKLLLDAGWEPYGQSGLDPNQSDSSMQYFKRNAIKLQSWVSTTPAEGGKTLIRYSTDLMSADLPAPPDATDPRYDDSNKKLDMDEPSAKTDAILAFYMDRLPKMGWKPTTEKPIVDEKERSQFLIFRNEQKELLSLDLTQFKDIVRVKLAHQTEAEVEEETRRAKEYAQKQQMEKEERERKIEVSVPLPANATKIEQSEANHFEFTLATGTGPATLEAFREHFKNEGWTEEEGSKFEKNTGDIDFMKEKNKYRFSIRYFDIGFGGAEFTVSAPKNIEFQPVASKLKAKPAGKEKPAADKAKMPKGKKKPAVPGLPELPEGVELPDEVNELLKKSIK